MVSDEIHSLITIQEVRDSKKALEHQIFMLLRAFEQAYQGCKVSEIDFERSREIGANHGKVMSVEVYVQFV
jgi:hypothetical protein